MASNMRAVHREFRPYVKMACKHGWRLTETGRDHLCLISPDGSTKIRFSRTPSDPSGVRNFRRDLQRAGAIN